MQQGTRTNSAQNAPLEILQDVFSLVPRTDLSCLRLVCRAWCDAAFSAFFSALHIAQRDDADEFISHLVHTPAACANVRELIISAVIDDSDYIPLLLQPLSGFFVNVSSLTLIIPATSELGQDSRFLAAFITDNLSAVTQLCVRGTFLPKPHDLNVFLSSFTRLESLCVHGARISDYKVDDMREDDITPWWPWPFGLRLFNTKHITKLSFNMRTTCLEYTQLAESDPSFDFPVLSTLDLHVEVGVIQGITLVHHTSVTNILTHVLRCCPVLSRFRVFILTDKRQYTFSLLMWMLREHHEHEFTLALHFANSAFADRVHRELRWVDNQAAAFCIGSRCSIELSWDSGPLCDASILMPNLYSKGMVKWVDPPHHNHPKFVIGQE